MRNYDKVRKNVEVVSHQVNSTRSSTRKTLKLAKWTFSLLKELLLTKSNICSLWSSHMPATWLRSNLPALGSLKSEHQTTSTEWGFLLSMVWQIQNFTVSPDYRTGVIARHVQRPKWAGSKTNEGKVVRRSLVIAAPNVIKPLYHH